MEFIFVPRQASPGFNRGKQANSGSDSEPLAKFFTLRVPARKFSPFSW